MLAARVLYETLIGSVREVMRSSTTLSCAMAKISADMQSVTSGDFVVTLSNKKVFAYEDLLDERINDENGDCLYLQWVPLERRSSDLHHSHAVETVLSLVIAQSDGVSQWNIRHRRCPMQNIGQHQLVPKPFVEERRREFAADHSLPSLQQPLGGIKKQVRL